MFFSKKKKEDKYIVVDCAFNCQRERCPKWVTLYHDTVQEDGTKSHVADGRCSSAWTPYLMVKILEEAKLLREAIESLNKEKDK